MFDHRLPFFFLFLAWLLMSPIPHDPHTQGTGVTPIEVEPDWR